MNYHKPVLLQQSIELLNINPSGTYVDVTFGGGGHSREILENLTDGKLYAFDQDADAHENAPDHPSFNLIKANFRHLKKSLRFAGVREIDGLLADLGISSHQIDEAERGFSLRYSGRLDMRMNQQADLDAHKVVNTYEEKDLSKVFWEYGELRNARALARQIVNWRTENPINTTDELKQCLQKFAGHQRQHQFWAKVFQAIRIEVNDEMGALHDLLEQSAEVLKPGGVLVFISYHSLEDRPVKNFFRYGNLEGEPQKDFYGNLIRPLEPVNRKPITADAEEVASNPRSRSARLRAAIKLEKDEE